MPPICLISPLKHSYSCLLTSKFISSRIPLLLVVLAVSLQSNDLPGWVCGSNEGLSINGEGGLIMVTCMPTTSPRRLCTMEKMRFST